MITSLCIAALYTRNIAAMVFAFYTAAHMVLFSGLTGWLYYLSAGATDVIILGILATTNMVSETTRGLILVSLVSLILNIYGQTIWFLYWPPGSYDSAFVCLYAVSVGIIIKGDHAGDTDLFNVFPAAGKGHFIHRILPEEARH